MDGEDETEIMKMLEETLKKEGEINPDSAKEQTSTWSDENGEIIINDELCQELRAEAQLTLDSLRNQGSAIGALLDDQEQFGIYAYPERQQFDNQKLSKNDQQRTTFDSSVWGSELGVEVLLSPVNSTQFPDDSVEGPKGRTDSEGEVESDEYSAGDDGGVYPLYTKNGGNGNGNGSNHYELPIRAAGSTINIQTVNPTENSIQIIPSYALGDGTSIPDSSITKEFSVEHNSTDLSDTDTDTNVILNETSSNLENKFTDILRASISLQQIQSETEDDSDDSTAIIRRKTVDAVIASRIDALDMDSLLGNTMATLARQLDINLGETINDDPTTMQQMQVLFILLFNTISMY
jgi:hypothetical protein